jgi:hypothetical protein
MQAIYRFGLATRFPPEQDEVTFEEMSQLSGMPLEQLTRILRLAMTYRIFREPKKGVVAHTAASRLLGSSPPMNHWTGFLVEELWPASTKVISPRFRVHGY